MKIYHSLQPIEGWAFFASKRQEQSTVLQQKKIVSALASCIIYSWTSTKWRMIKLDFRHEPSKANVNQPELPLSPKVYTWTAITHKKDSYQVRGRTIRFKGHSGATVENGFLSVSSTLPKHLHVDFKQFMDDRYRFLGSNLLRSMSQWFNIRIRV